MDSKVELAQAQQSIKTHTVEDEYELIEEIGVGQYAVVHRAEHKVTGKVCY